MKNEFNILSKQESENILKSYKSDVNLSDYKNKLFEDPEYSQAETKSLINYLVLNGDFQIDTFEDDNKYMLKFISKKHGESILIAFPTLFERDSILNNIYPYVPVHTLIHDEYVENNINKNALIKKIGIGVLISTISISTIYKIFKNKKYVR